MLKRKGWGLRGKASIISPHKSHLNRTLTLPILARPYGGGEEGKVRAVGGQRETEFLPLDGPPPGFVLPPRAPSLLSSEYEILPDAPDPTGTLYPLSGPGRASALLYPGCHPVSVWNCPHPPLLSTKGSAGQGGVRDWKGKWEGGSSKDSKRRNKRGSPTKFAGKGDGPLTSPFLITFPPFQIQVRKAAIASYEVWTLPHLVSTAFQTFSPSGAPAWGSGPLGGHASQVLICIHLRGLPPTLPSQASSKIFGR